MPTTSVLMGLALDVLVISVLVFGVYRPRHRKSDLALSYIVLNLGVFGAVALLAGAEAGLALGMGLFGILSIIRLRSSAISQTEVAYYFVALVLGLVNALGGQWPVFMLAVNALLLAALVVLDRGAEAISARPTEKRRVVLDVVHDSHASLLDDLSTRLRTVVIGATVEEIDFVREVMVVVVEVETPRKRPPAPAGHEPLDAGYDPAPLAATRTGR